MFRSKQFESLVCILQALDPSSPALRLALAALSVAGGHTERLREVGVSLLCLWLDCAVCFLRGSNRLTRSDSSSFVSLPTAIYFPGYPCVTAFSTPVLDSNALPSFLPQGGRVETSTSGAMKEAGWVVSLDRGSGKIRVLFDHSPNRVIGE